MARNSPSRLLDSRIRQSPVLVEDWINFTRLTALHVAMVDVVGLLLSVRIVGWQTRARANDSVVSERVIREPLWEVQSFFGFCKGGKTLLSP